MKKLLFINLLLVILFVGCKKTLTEYAFHEIPKLLPEGTDGSAGKDGSYVLFGDWPQTVKSPDVMVDEEKSFERGMFTYFLGNDGNYYAKAAENSYTISNKYSDGTSAKKDKDSYKYFKVEPIKWRIITTDYQKKGQAYLLAENILDSGIPFYAGAKHRDILGKAIEANNYKYSTIRAYLNGFYEKEDIQVSLFKSYVDEAKGFLQSAFTVDGQNLICVTHVDNSLLQMSYDGIKGTSEARVCDDTFDKVFLPSTLELVKVGGFGFPDYLATCNDSNGAPENYYRLRSASDFALARGVYQGMGQGLGGYWWTRSPWYINDYDIRYVFDNGRMRATDFVYNEADGIVPAVCVPLEVLK